MTGEAAPGAGDIKIMLGGQEETLRPSLEACIAISGIAGGLTAAVARCRNMDFTTVVEVICHGLGATSPKLRKDVQQAVYEAGVIAVAAEAIEFIRVIANGGRPLPEEGEDQGEGPLAQPSPSENTTSPS